MDNPTRYLPIRLAEDEKGDEFDLTRMPHLMMTGGTAKAHVRLIRRILNGWKGCPGIAPAVLDLTGTLAPETPPVSERDLTGRLRELESVRQARYEKLGAMHLKSVVQYREQGYEDMPFLPVIVCGFAELKGSAGLTDIEALICRIAQRGRAAGIHIVLSCTDAEVPAGRLEANFPAKIRFRRGEAFDCEFIRD